MSPQRFSLALLLGTATAGFAQPGAPTDVKIHFSRQVAPIISSKCYHCHGQDEHSRKAELRLDIRDEALRERDGSRAIVPGKPEQSDLIARVLSKDRDEVMPPPKEGHAVTPEEAEILRKWIAQGAEYEGHWAFRKPSLPAIPVLEKEEKARNPVDHFIAAGLRESGLRQSPETDRYSLLRRLSLDLVGLPPTPAELAAFESDTSPQAYENAVDRLLDSPHFGEKWARHWLDIARYADSSGYGSDMLRLNIWPYREWVINAFNANVPFDQFSTDQIAGDLLPGATPEQRLATAFHRNTMTQNEGGTSDEEYRVAAVKDRVATTMQAWMGLTAGCAQCHSHKFDPISQREYYQLFAIFNQTEDADRADESPLLPFPTRHEEERRKSLQAQIRATEAESRSDSPEFEAEFGPWLKTVSKPTPWTPLPLLSGASTNGSFVADSDGTLHQTGNPSAAESYVLKFRNPGTPITAVRVEVLPGDSPSGEFALTAIQFAQPVLENKPASARYVRIEHRPKELLQIAELEVFSGGQNVALKGKATQSTTHSTAKASKAIDGNTEGAFAKGSVSHTADNDPNPWWEVDLGKEFPVDKIVFWNRTEAAQRIVGATLVLLDNRKQPVFEQSIEAPPTPSAEWQPVAGKIHLVTRATASQSLPGSAPGDATDRNSKSAWRIPSSQSAAAVFQFHTPVQDPEIQVTLRMHDSKNAAPQRFKVSATGRTGEIWELPAATLATIQSPDRSPEQNRELRDFYRPHSKAFANISKKLADLKADLAKVKPVEVPVMREKPGMRKSHLLVKGNYLTPGEEVPAGLPASFHPAPPEPSGAADRLALARWIFSPENPLTARVAANRFWAQIFGTGLVETEEDFGTQGTWPSHPELLDWLAIQFQSGRDQGGLAWDMKRFIRLLVTSHTYRQQARPTAESGQKDPRNRLLSHFTRRRLDAEGIRDQALAISGLLSPKIGGPSVYPPQPQGLWTIAFRGSENYPTSTGEDRWRRSLYTIWRRISPNPTMLTFDAPTREGCTLRRVPTNTPLQAFVTLNDPVYFEAAQALGRRLLSVGKPVDETLRDGLRLVLQRPPSQTQLRALRDLYDSALATYSADPEAARRLASSKELPLPDTMDPARAAAWTVVGNVLLNLDGVLMKP